MKQIYWSRFSFVLFVILLLVACGGAEERKEKYFKRGMELYQQGNYVKARLEFKNVLQIDPKSAKGYYMFGLIEEKDQNWRKAYAMFLRAVELDPQHVAAQVHLGRLYALSGAAEKALQAAETALKIDPEDSAALVLKGLVRARMGEKLEAIKEARSAFEVDPKNQDAISLLASLYADQGEMDRAIDLARKGLEANPKMLQPHLLLAQLYEKVGNTEGTIELLNKMIQLKPDDLQRRSRLAAYYLNKDNKQAAEKVLREAVSLLPDSAGAKMALVEFLNQYSGLAEAENALKQFIDQSPDLFPLQLGLANLYAQTDRKDESVTILQQVIDRAGESEYGLKAKTKLASHYVTSNNTDKALALLNEVLEADPKEKEALLTRAAIALNSDDSDKGIGDLRTILREDPTNVKAYRLKARAHLQKEEIALARQSLETAIQVRPQEAAANFELVQLLVQTGELDDAIAVLEKMRKFAPDNMNVLQGIIKIRAQQEQWDQVGQMAVVIKEKHPDNALGYHYDGLSLQGIGKHAESVEAFELALKIKPDAVEPLIALAKGYLALNKPEEALARVQKVITRNPKHFVAVNLQGEIYLSQKRFADAEQAFNQAMALNPKWSTPYLNLAKISKAVGKAPEAPSYIRQGYEKSGDIGLGLKLASLLDQSGNNAESIRIYRELLTRRPGYPVAANNLAMILIRGEPNQATLDEALELVKGFQTSDNPVFLDTLGWVYVKRGEFDKAVTVLERASIGKSVLPVINYHLGAAYYSLERKADAKKQLGLALASGETFEDVALAREMLEALK